MSRIASAHRRARRPDAVAFYLSGQLADRGLLRRQQADEGNSSQRQCRYQFAAVHGVVGRGPSPGIGADTVPGCYEDLDQADLLVLVGSNAAWCHPVLFSAHARQQAAARRRMS